MRNARANHDGRERARGAIDRIVGRRSLILGLIPQGALGAAVVRARMLGARARKLSELAVDLRLDAPHRQELKFRFCLAGPHLGADLELPFPDVRNRRH